ncbi:hypothetical protein [Chelatococcus reniformis]|uniref:Uncharacterized protein n=1 Tax=Chelatococcus reniformis TaxID=1494448 RepID=A0A916UJV6_9HYPH|nr:hypothetical protein [Chelatococcus reniformis]GGC75025.1 hypothetical protein GCM10010994_36830 [Chelatococcus reniformis]
MSDAAISSRSNVIDLATHRRARAAADARRGEAAPSGHPLQATPPHGIVWVPVMMMAPFGVAMGLPFTVPMMVPCGIG